jgi:hypothetical protein
MKFKSQFLLVFLVKSFFSREAQHSNLYALKTYAEWSMGH